MKPSLILRFLLAFLFIFVSTQKIFEPYQNFLYVIEAYRLFPPAVAGWIARVLPWVEFFLGVFLLLGLWIRQAVLGITVLIVSFLTVVGQAVIRGLPIKNADASEAPCPCHCGAP